MTYIKENKSDFTGCYLTNVQCPVTKLQKLYSLPRNLRVGNKSPLPFLEKLLCMGNLLSAHKIFIERPAIVHFKKTQKFFVNNFCVTEL